MLRTDDAGRRTPDDGRWTLDVGRWTMDAGPSAPYYKLTGELKTEHCKKRKHKDKTLREANSQERNTARSK